MTEPTSDDEDHADYTDDHQEERQIDQPGSTPDDGNDIHEVAPDVADTPDPKPPASGHVRCQVES